MFRKCHKCKGTGKALKGKSEKTCLYCKGEGSYGRIDSNDE